MDVINVYLHVSTISVHLSMQTSDPPREILDEIATL